MKLISQESRSPVHDRIEWRPWWNTGINRVWVRRLNADGNTDKRVHFGGSSEGEPWMYHRMVPVSTGSIENELVVSDRPSLHTTDVIVNDRSIQGILPNRSIIEARPKGKLSVLEHRMWRGRVSTGPTSKEDVVLGLVKDERFRDQKPFFPPVSVRRELWGISWGRLDLVREIRSSGPRTVVDNWGDADSPVRYCGWDTDNEGEESG